jgi:hypothetical protein
LGECVIAVFTWHRSANAKPLWCGGSEERQVELTGLLFRSRIEAWFVEHPVMRRLSEGCQLDRRLTTSDHLHAGDVAFTLRSLSTLPSKRSTTGDLFNILLYQAMAWPIGAFASGHR